MHKDNGNLAAASHLPNSRQLRKLKTFNKSYCLTIYAPYISPTAATNPNRIALKTLLKQARAELLAEGLDPKLVKKTLRPAHAVLEDRTAWPAQHASLALFIHPRLFRHYYLPDHATPSLLSIGQGFNLGPLLAVIRDNQAYYLLALSHKHVSLYQGDHYHLRQLHPKNFPTSMKEALHIDEYPNWRETHNIAPASAGKGSEAYHSQYNVAQTDKTMLQEFFRRLDRRLRPLLAKHPAPLFLGGVGYLLPIYRQVNTYAGLRAKSLIGNLDRARLADLRERVWQLI